MAHATPVRALSAATRQLLRPLVRILLRNNVSHRTFADLAKQVYVEVANAEFAIPGKKQTVSRIAILSGLTRKEVQQLLTLPSTSKSIVNEEYHRASRVISGWLRDPKYGDGKGHPRPLSMEGKGGSFSQLVKRYSGDIPVRALLDELMRVGAVKQLRDGRIGLVSRGYIPRNGTVPKLRVLGADTADLITTIDHNIYGKPSKPRFQRKLMYDNVPLEAVAEFRTLAAAESQELLEKLDRWLAHRDRDVNPVSKGTGRVRVGLGIYHFEEQEPAD
ncbi:conserved hypothetical protein [Candidatus Nitrospira nitrosa]|uniref:Uncharacterized protein n=1 Tax=Candidatus Nitrospira nitrosa TaxID=1742972 RepID=A0A0S4LRA7_9BACT|nr:DUF6502 family protein [Candidatus Nitrospira nitrosa]CUS39210.1 conserved hypothetical protein [Candidatus Nitrospira nitrosa]